METSGNTILITGATAGIGRALALEFQRAGNTVIAAGRRRDILEQMTIEYPGLVALPLDVADAEAIAEFSARVTTDHPALNVLINNAGIMRRGQGIDLASAEAIVTTNLLGPIRLTSALLPHLMAQPRSTIINVSSGLAFVPFIHTPTYCATKAAIHSWTVAMREQLRDSGIEVIELIPPAVQTELMPGQADSAHAMPLNDFISETMALFRPQPTPAEICVERVQTLRNVVSPDKFARALSQLNQLARYQDDREK